MKTQRDRPKALHLLPTYGDKESDTEEPRPHVVALAELWDLETGHLAWWSSLIGPHRRLFLRAALRHVARVIPPRWTYLKELSAVTLPKINKFIAGSDAKTSEKWQVFFVFLFFFFLILVIVASPVVHTWQPRCLNLGLPWGHGERGGKDRGLWRVDRDGE